MENAIDYRSIQSHIPQQYPAEMMIRGEYWPAGFAPATNNIQPSTYYASLNSSASSTIPLGTLKNQWIGSRVPNMIGSSLYNGTMQSQHSNLSQQQIIQQRQDLEMISK